MSGDIVRAAEQLNAADKFLCPQAARKFAADLAAVSYNEMTELRERKRNRLSGYDYSQSGYYFVTVCTDKRIEWFDEVVDAQMKLNSNGKIIEQQWEWLSAQHPYIELDQFIIMPNHIHGILIVVGNGRDRSLQTNPFQPKSLSSLVGAFKTTSSKRIHQAGSNNFKWQKSFHDHIIRNDRSLNEIRKYIANNPMGWADDEENIKNV